MHRDDVHYSFPPTPQPSVPPEALPIGQRRTIVIPTPDGTPFAAYKTQVLADLDLVVDVVRVRHVSGKTHRPKTPTGIEVEVLTPEDQEVVMERYPNAFQRARKEATPPDHLVVVPYSFERCPLKALTQVLSQHGKLVRTQILEKSGRQLLAEYESADEAIRAISAGPIVIAGCKLHPRQFFPASRKSQGTPGPNPGQPQGAQAFLYGLPLGTADYQLAGLLKRVGATDGRTRSYHGAEGQCWAVITFPNEATAQAAMQQRFRYNHVEVHWSGVPLCPRCRKEDHTGRDCPSKPLTPKRPAQTPTSNGAQLQKGLRFNQLAQSPEATSTTSEAIVADALAAQAAKYEALLARKEEEMARRDRDIAELKAMVEELKAAILGNAPTPAPEKAKRDTTEREAPSEDAAHWKALYEAKRNEHIAVQGLLHAAQEHIAKQEVKKPHPTTPLRHTAKTTRTK